MIKYFSCFGVLILPFWLSAQITITGRVLNMADTKPIAGASVFLSNTTIGAETSDDGYFTLNYVKPGKYDMVISVVGFETYFQSVLVEEHDIQMAPISLISATIALNAVKIRPDNEWFRLYKAFKEQFLGTSAYAQQCKIMNPDSLDLYYDSRDKQLTARSRGFLIIENKALGYKIKYLLIRFVADRGKNQRLSYMGHPLFEELKGNAAEKQTWAKNRLDCYLGSSMHFLRSVIADKVETEGFEVHKIYTTLNPQPFILPSNNGLVKVDNFTKYRDRFVDTSLKRLYYFDETEKKGIYALNAPFNLYIAYKNKEDYDKNRATLYSQFSMPNYQTTIARFAQKPDSAGIPTDTIWVAYPKLWAFKRLLKRPYAFFDQNGMLVNPLSMYFDGYWAFLRVGDLLPVDYEPATKNRTRDKSK